MTMNVEFNIMFYALRYLIITQSMAMTRIVDYNFSTLTRKSICIVCFL